MCASPRQGQSPRRESRRPRSALCQGGWGSWWVLGGSGAGQDRGSLGISSISTAQLASKNSPVSRLSLLWGPSPAPISLLPGLQSFWSSTDASRQAHRKYSLSHRQSQENASLLLMRLGPRECFLLTSDTAQSPGTKEGQGTSRDSLTSSAPWPPTVLYPSLKSCKAWPAFSLGLTPFLPLPQPRAPFLTSLRHHHFP